MKFGLFCSVILVAVCCIVDNASGDTLPPPPLRYILNCKRDCDLYYGGSKEEFGNCMKVCEAGNDRTPREVEEESHNIDYDCNLFPDFDSIPTKHWHAFALTCQIEVSKGRLKPRKRTVSHVQ